MRSHAKSASAGSIPARQLVVTACLALLFILSAVPAANAANKALLGSFGTETGVAGGKISTGTGVAVNRAGSGGVTAGAVYVPSSANARVEQFSATGEFIRAFGWDVVASGEHNTGASEQQKLLVKASGGKFALSFSGATTGANGTGTWSSGVTTITLNSTSSGAFAAGQIVTTGNGTGIQTGTEVVSVVGSTITISKPTTAASTSKTIAGHNLPYNASAGEVQSALNGLSTVGGVGGSVTVLRTELGATEFEYVVSFGGGFGGNDVAQASATNAGLEGVKTATVETTVPGGGLEICQATSTPVDVCKAGSGIASAGALSNPQAIAVDQATGNLFIASNGAKRIDVFSAKGLFEGAFGWGVDTGAAAFEFCSTSSSCQAGIVSASAGAFSNLDEAALALHPSSGHLYVGERGNRRVNEYSFVLNGSSEVTGAAFVRAFGWKVKADAPVEELQICTTASGCLAGTAGGGNGQFPTNTPASLAVDAGGFIYAVSANGTCNGTTNPCRVQKFNPDGSFEEVFGPDSGGAEACQLTWTELPARERAAVGIAVDPSNQHVYITRKASSTGTLNNAAATFELCEFDSTGTLLDRSPTSPLATNNSGYLRPAIGLGGSVYVHSPIDGQSGVIYLLGPVPPPGVKIAAATDVGQTTAKLNGAVTVPSPGGAGFEPKYRFEYSADNGLNWTKAPATDTALGTSTPSTVNVSTTVAELQPGITYRVRMVATTSSSATSEETTFTTGAARPTVAHTHALPVSDTTATLRGTINPNNQGTTYRFEWGTTAAYGNEAPDFEPFLGSGGQEANASAALSGLKPGTTYHFRLVATNATGAAFGPDATFTTNACPDENAFGLPDCRVYELVSPADLGPVGEAGVQSAISNNLQVQASKDGSRFAFQVAYGLPGSTTGSEVLHRADRGPTGWISTQLSSPDLVPPLPAISESGQDIYLSDDLKCGFLSSFAPLTADAPTDVVEEGGINLFRRNFDGSHTVLTAHSPTNPTGATNPVVNAFVILGASSDCDRVFFASFYRYPGIEFSGDLVHSIRGLYEWDHGTLRSAGVIPGPSGPVVPIPAEAGAGDASRYNAASNVDGSRLFFTATRQKGDGPAGAAEVGKKAIFLRGDGATAIDVSRSQTSVPSQGARYQTASKDGSRVFFLANYGLTSPVSNGTASADCNISGAQECDLYEYDVDSGALTALSATTMTGNPRGAMVEGVLDSSEDGTHVYFAAQGQLVPGKGNTYAQNTTGTGAYNIYLSEEDSEGFRHLFFVATVPADDLLASGIRGSGLLVAPKNNASNSVWSSRSTPDGRHLLFQTAGNVTGYDSGGVFEAYLYSADTESVVCVSCRRDGLPSVGSSESSFVGLAKFARPLLVGRDPGPNFHHRRLSISDDGNRVFFNMPDALAPGAYDGGWNVYQWEKGQISVLESGPANTRSRSFLGASSDGDSVFIRTAERLTPEDTDDRPSIYVARVDGGFVPPPIPPAPCDPLSENDCQGAPGSGVGAAPTPPSSTLSGPGNQTSERKQHAKKKKRKKQSGKRKAKQRQRQQRRDVNHDRRAAK